MATVPMLQKLLTYPPASFCISLVTCNLRVFFFLPPFILERINSIEQQTALLNNRFQDVKIREGETMIDKNDKILRDLKNGGFFPILILAKFFFFFWKGKWNLFYEEKSEWTSWFRELFDMTKGLDSRTKPRFTRGGLQSVDHPATSLDVATPWIMMRGELLEFADSIWWLVSIITAGNRLDAHAQFRFFLF